MEQILTNDCVQLTTTLVGDLPTGRENGLRNVPPQTAQNKSYLQLHAPAQTTIHSLYISSYGVHESFLFHKLFSMMFTKAVKEKNAEER